MKYLLRFLTVVFFVSGTIFAQLPEDFVAPDFTITDIDGNEHNLYSIINKNRPVVLNLFDSASDVCWNFVRLGPINDFNNLYGPEGDHSAFVISVESNSNKSLSHMLGNEILNDPIGDWSSMIHYPLVHDDDASVLDAYGGWMHFAYPLVFVICPDKSVTEIGHGPTLQFSEVGHFWGLETFTEKVFDTCSSAIVGLNENVEEVLENKLSIFPNPASDHAVLELRVKKSDDAVIDIVNTLGQQVFVQRSKMNKGLNTIQIPVESLTTGMYYVSVRIADEVHVDKLNVVD